jgi:2-polyprenyl-3-methyl-5-hydroxy-6-metoxy-1,4-benzoquinol methylase
MSEQPERSPFDSAGKRIGVFVVAYNAESQIERTLERIPDDIWRAITVLYIVDDCSRDETVERALAFDRWREKIVVLRNRVQQQYGGDQKIGYQYAIDHGLDVIVTLHADGKYAPERLADLLLPVVTGQAGLVVGSRMLKRGDALRGGMPLYKCLGNMILTRTQNTLSGLSLTEFHSGYRAYSVAFLKKIPFWENSDEWHFDSEVLLQAAATGDRIVEVSIPTYYGAEISHVNGVVYAFRCIATSLAYFLQRKGILYSRNYDVALQGRRYFEKFNDPASSHSLIFERLKREGLAGKRILELGVGDASLTKRMAEVGAFVDGVEIDSEAAALASPYCKNVYVGDLDEIDRIVADAEYDMVIAADVLEHLKDPEFVLSKLKKYLKRGGFLVVSLPNTANLYVRLNLLWGRFPYYRKGLLDRTHLHFFTLKTAETMLWKTGWRVDEKAVSAIPLPVVFPFVLKAPFRWGLRVFHGMTRAMKGLLAYQGIFYCRNPNLARLL